MNINEVNSNKVAMFISTFLHLLSELQLSAGQQVPYVVQKIVTQAFKSVVIAELTGFWLTVS